MKWPECGVHYGVPFGEYRSDDITQEDTLETAAGKSVSKSMISDFIADPYKWKMSAKKKQNDAMKRGSLFDCLLTTPHEFDSQFVVSPFDSFRSGEAKAWKIEQSESGVAVVTGAEIQKARDQIKAVMSKRESAQLINGSKRQVAFRHKTKYPFFSKGLIDILPADESCLVDLKVCRGSALDSRRALSKYILDFNYHIQAGAYCDGWSVANGSCPYKFKFIFVTATAPFRVAVVDLALQAIMLGADKYREGMEKYFYCLEAARWPSIWDGEAGIDIPHYGYPEEESKQEFEASTFKQEWLAGTQPDETK